MRIATLILSAGKSTRMGTAKQILKVGDTTLLGRSIEQALQSKANSVFCLLGSNYKVIRDTIKSYDVTPIINTNYNKGLSTSIYAGIDHIKDKNFDAVLILLGDQPKVDADFINVLIDSFETSPNQISASGYSGSIGVPAIFPKTYYTQLQDLKGDKGAKELLNKSYTKVIPISNDQLIDIDTKEDYHQFLKSLGKTS
ncbi:nucleotidyltransferase family protein [Psychroserpens algicola]|uniref:Nucleotidyltransferase family protein n=1 Tax=Psychroserpens algicola TaxID=1719034 RepID=A0ABT0H7X4_9FLAO|nr:nucleotidyltransferase family protein [Psychroserpens algicola]MCK8480464.1 nucleotidyltransferase family protein [Psychroserpens algicola]